MRPFTSMARPFVAAPYIVTGIETLRNPRERATQVGPAVKPVADRIEWMPKDPETLVRIEGAISLGTGALLLTGRFRRLSTLLMAAQLLPALATGHRYWNEDDPDRRASERSHLLKNAGLFGALIMAGGNPRRSPRGTEVRKMAREAKGRGGAEANALRREAARQIHEARAAGKRNASKAAKASKSVSKSVSKSGGGKFGGGRSGGVSGMMGKSQAKAGKLMAKTGRAPKGRMTQAKGKAKQLVSR
ncbi:DoxX family protein [Spirillospora albida]|uniref:DoxX family protein n=1 Tax=Spirillospora albida TaxID=58123 RepID=UPI0009FF6E64|nr:DoxX family protein [Spirillospora albida]